MSEGIKSKKDVSPELVAALTLSAGLNVAPDRIDVITLRLSELFDLAAPLEGLAFEEIEVTQPFDPRWTEEASR